MVHISSDIFVRWNEEMSIKHNPDIHHNHPNPLIRTMENKRTESIIDFIDVNETDKVLDVGCGAGNMLAQLKSGKFYGIDLSGFVLGLAKKKLNNKAVLQKGNAESLPFKANSFDKLFCSEVIEHTLNPQLIIAEMHRILKVHGICVISIPNEKLSIRIKRILKLIGLYRFIMPANNSDKNNASDVCEWHLHVFSLDLLRKMVSGKFKIKDIKGVPFRIFPVKYVVRLDKIVE